MDEATRPACLTLDDEGLWAQCRMTVFKASGPGGQHRNKVSSAVRLRHEPTGITAEATESRSQHDNRRQALRRLRMHIACRLRRPFPREGPLPPVLAKCLFQPHGQAATARRRLEVGRKDHRFWAVAAMLLDALESTEGQVAKAAGWLGITTGNLSAILTSDRHLLAASQDIRRRYKLKPLS